MRQEQRLQEEKRTTSRLVRAQKAVKRKYSLLKRGQLQTKLETASFFEPLKDILRQPVTTVSTQRPRPSLAVSKRRKRTHRRVGKRGKPYPAYKSEEEDVMVNKEDEEDPFKDLGTGEYIKTEPNGSQVFISNPLFSPSPSPFLGEESSTSTPVRRQSEVASDELQQVVHTPEGKNEMERHLRQFNIYARPFIRSLLTGEDSGLDLDKVYGPKVGARGRLTLGSKALSMDRDYIYLGDKLKFPATEGLLNLLFLKNPKEYSAEDRANYRDLIVQSNAANQGYSKFRPLMTSGDKYKTLLKTLLPPQKLGRGFVKLPKSDNPHPPTYVYFDDPNELVDRLRLLFASKHAGHTAHDPEIYSIIQELKELGIIE